MAQLEKTIEDLEENGFNIKAGSLRAELINLQRMINSPRSDKTENDPLGDYLSEMAILGFKAVQPVPETKSVLQDNPGTDTALSALPPFPADSSPTYLSPRQTLSRSLSTSAAKLGWRLDARTSPQKTPAHATP